MRIGLVGKPNVGKSTLWSAATHAEAAIGNYPFTTINPNVGVGAVRVHDPGIDFNVKSSPKHGTVHGATRFVPIELVDVAGLVPGAHQGRGLGNKFLSDLNRADALIHVVDASGSTDAEGNVVDPHTRDPALDIQFLEEEIELWILGILEDGWDRLAKKVQQENRKPEVAVAEKLGGLGVNEQRAAAALRESRLAGKRIVDWDTEGLRALAKAIRHVAKPMVVALNKADAADAATMTRLRALPGAVPVAAASEIALQKGAKAGLLDYTGGASTFTTKGTLNPAQQKGLDYIRTHVFDRFGSTGVHQILEEAAFQLLKLIPVFPVEDETKLTDKDGRVLPDCHLVPQGTTAKELAARVHTDLAEHFIRAIDCRTHRAVGADHVLAPGDVIKIVAKT